MSGPFEDMQRLILEAAGDGIFLCAELTAQEGQAEVPHRDGILEDSIVAIVEGTDAVVIAEGPYAVAQHEREDYKHRPGRKSHYLSDPLERNAADGTYERLVGYAVERKLG